MSAPNENTVKPTNWNLWLTHVEDIPSAAYIVKNDEGLTLVGGNQAFYRLLGYSELEVRQRYGGCLSALLDAESLKVLPSLQEAQDHPTTIKQHLLRNGSDAWIITELTLHPHTDGDVLCCISVDITEHEAHRNRLFSLEETVQLIAEQTDQGYLEYDLETGCAYIRFARSILPDILYSPDGMCRDFVQQMISSGIVAAGYESVLRSAFHPDGDTNKKATYELQLLHPEKGLRWTKLSVAVKTDGKRAVVLWEDITREKETASNYLNETQFYQAILSEKDAYGHIDVTENRITRVGGMWNLYNELIDTVTYSQLAEEFIYKIVHPEDRKHYLDVMKPENFIQSLDNGIDRVGCEFRRIVDQNKMVWMQLNVYLFRDPLTTHVLALLTIQNINVRKKQELLLLYDSRMDQLTHVYNRRVAENMICAHLSQVPSDELCAFVVLDIDDFKRINDDFGHHAGDQALIHLSSLLNHSFRQDDVVGRFGGDEFILFLTDTTSRDCIQARMDELFCLLREDQGDTPFSCSAGIALCQGAVPYEQLFRQADHALYQAKSAGKGQFEFYEGPSLLTDRRKASRSAPSRDTTDSLGENAHTPIEWTDSASTGNQNFDSLVGSQGDIAYLINPNNYDLICGNQAFYDRLGISSIQCVGMKCHEIMHKRNTPCPFCSKANWSTDKFYMWRNLNTSLEQEFLIKNKLVFWQGQEALLAIAVDISNNKSIVDSIDNSATETHSILSGVQHMAESSALSLALKSALETIGNFYRADTACFWHCEQGQKQYNCTYFWSHDNQKKPWIENQHTINQWLENYDWDQPVMFESPEAMLNYSYDMYLYMKEHGIRSQQWTRIKEGNEILGYIVIDNSSSNLQNIAFLESFAVFIASELKKRRLIETTIYSGLHDDLTDLLSRKSFEIFTTEYYPDQISCIGVVISNFNNLKGINSTKGFQSGNYFIKQFSDMLRKAFDCPHIFRLNGDEFLVIMPDVTRTVMENCITSLEEQIEDNGMFTISIGYSWDDVEKDLPSIIEHATQAMKVHKKRHYDTMTGTVDTERRTMLNHLVSCIENREFEVFLQPKVELLHNNVIGAEALIRYHHKELGYIQPSKFIDILEKNNLIRYIDLFVFEEVCKQLECWKKRGLSLPVISLNFSRLTLLEQDILSTVENIISRYDVPKKHLEIEVTETIANMGKSILYQTMQDLYEAGYAISLDDFGTKYTNLSILADLDFDILKVDKSLIGELSGRANHQLIMKNIISMCEDLGISVLAEGIETKEQESILQTLNCGLGQGYLYGKPMPIDEFDEKYIKIGQYL